MAEIAHMRRGADSADPGAGAARGGRVSPTSGGFEALTMRGLAQRLGVQAMSLYNHIADKADLRDGIVDLVMASVEVPVPGGDWRVGADAVARSRSMRSSAATRG